jgi:putative membrane protein
LSDLNDPRVLFAAERTLLAWNRTAAGLMALGFFIDRASLMGVAGETDRKFAVWIGIAFLLLGVLLGALSVVQYRRSVASLRPIEIPPRYWLNLAVFTSLAVSVLGLLLALYLLRTL